MNKLKEIWRHIDAHLYVYGEGWGIAIILMLYFYDAFKYMFLGDTNLWYWGIKAKWIVGIGVGLIIWSKHLKKD
jgi:hypothetical protein